MERELVPPWQFRTTAADRNPSDSFGERYRAGTLSEGNVRNCRKEREKRESKGKWEKQGKIYRTDVVEADGGRLQ